MMISDNATNRPFTKQGHMTMYRDVFPEYEVKGSVSGLYKMTGFRTTLLISLLFVS